MEISDKSALHTLCKSVSKWKMKTNTTFGPSLLCSYPYFTTKATEKILCQEQKSIPCNLLDQYLLINNYQ